MATVLDVAAYILFKKSPMAAMKLQKLVYYSQAWSLVWDDAPLFLEHIEAWANGPVAPVLYRAHRRQFEVVAGDIPADLAALTKDGRETVNSVVKYYGRHSSHWLSNLTHRERPWREAREGLRPGERGNREITRDVLAEYYGSL